MASTKGTTVGRSFALTGACSGRRGRSSGTCRSTFLTSSAAAVQQECIYLQYSNNTAVVFNNTAAIQQQYSSVQTGGL